MPAFNFQKWLVPAILSGDKLHTIRIERADQRQHAKIGDKISLYVGMRTTGCELLLESRCNRYEPIFITEEGFYLNGQKLSWMQIDWLARNDGFTNGQHFFSWFLAQHKLPFKGALIGWEDVIRPWYFDPLKKGIYGVIEADPPWEWQSWGTENPKDRPYETMPTHEIAAMPVNQLAAPSAILFLWTTWSHIHSGIEVLQEWGFELSSGGAWFKWTKHGKEHFSTGHILRSGCCEPFLIGTRGNPVIADKGIRNTLQTFEQQNTISDKVREHSRKPDQTYDLLDRLWPGALRCSLFSRQRRKGWDVWGKQIDHFKAGDSNV